MRTFISLSKTEKRAERRAQHPRHVISSGCLSRRASEEADGSACCTGPCVPCPYDSTTTHTRYRLHHAAARVTYGRIDRKCFWTKKPSYTFNLKNSDASILMPSMVTHLRNWRGFQRPVQVPAQRSNCIFVFGWTQSHSMLCQNIYVRFFLFPRLMGKIEEEKNFLAILFPLGSTVSLMVYTTDSFGNISDCTSTTGTTELLSESNQRTGIYALSLRGGDRESIRRTASHFFQPKNFFF